MPYLTDKRRKEIFENLKTASGEGDWNFLYTLDYLREWLKPDNQRYHTIHRIKKASISLTSDLTEGTDTLLIGLGVSFKDIITARAAAYDEFRRRVVDPYEEYCIAKNGDIDEYQQADMLLNQKFTKG